MGDTRTPKGNLWVIISRVELLRWFLDLDDCPETCRMRPTALLTGVSDGRKVGTAVPPARSEDRLGCFRVLRLVTTKELAVNFRPELDGKITKHLIAQTDRHPT